MLPTHLHLHVRDLDSSARFYESWFAMRESARHGVQAMLQRMRESRVPIVKPLYEDESFVSFRCADPDGHAIEVYWE